MRESNESRWRLASGQILSNPNLTLPSSGHAPAIRVMLLIANVRAMNTPEQFGIPDYEFRLVFGVTEIDYDPAKEELNRKNHQYSLASALLILKNLVWPTGPKQPHLIKGPFLEKGEVRHMHMSIDDDGKVVLMVTTMRPEETVWVISFRRASPQEREEFRALTGYSE